MSMELISREDAIKQADYLCLETGYDNEKVEEMLKELPTVKAIPLDRVEQIRKEMLNYLDSREKVADDEWVSYEISEMRKYIQDKFKGVSDGRT